MPKTKRKSRAVRAKRLTKVPRKSRQARPNPSDFEDLLIDTIIRGGGKAVNSTDIENLIYNTTGMLAELGYSFGFSVGKAITVKLENEAPITAVLDRIGMHKALYYPLGDKVIVTSRPHQRATRPQMDRSIHVYECGLMAGYLSASTGVHIRVEETRCIYNGSDSCQFVGFPFSERPKFSGMGVGRISDAIAHTLKDGSYESGTGEYYRVLSFLPLMDVGISAQVANIMLISGEKLGTVQGDTDIRKLVSKLSNYFGIKEAKVETHGIKSIIKLRYESYNSIQAFAAVPVAAIIGFANSTGKSGHASFRTNRDGSYTAEIELKKNKM